MNHPTYILLYVDDPQASGRFYRALLDAEPVESSATFVLFALASGLMLGLWSRATVTPPPAAAGGGAEVGISVETADAVDATFADWSVRGIAIAQEPTDLDFGRSFTALDPDGHRLRVFAVAP
jgi:catechol 2,3-dioxygenase-like lactoylglutathione lyase family enzyme